MKAKIIETLNGLCIHIATSDRKLVAEIADKIDALQSCNVVELRFLPHSVQESIIIVSDSLLTAKEDILTILSEYHDKD